MRTAERPAIEFWVALAAGCAIAAVCYFVPSVTLLVAEAEYRAVDWRFHIRGPRPPAPGIAIVAIDDQSLSAVGRWPWPRMTMARLINAIEEAGARVVVVDVLFAEPGEAEGDRHLVEVMLRHRNVYMPLFISSSRPPPWLYGLPCIARWQRVRLLGPPAVRQMLYDIPGLSVPLRQFAEAAAGLGIVDLVGSGDGIYRDMALIGQIDDQLIPSMPLLLGAECRGVPPQQIAVAPGQHLVVGGHQLSLDAFGLTPVNYAGPTGTYPHVSAASILNGDAAALGQLSQKIVLIGATAGGLYDLRPTPFDAQFRGVEALANATGNVLTGTSLIFPREVKAVALAVLITLGVAAQVGLLPGLWGAISAAILVITYWLLSILAFSGANVVLPLVPGTAAGAAALLTGLAARFSTAERERHKAVQVFGRFVPPEIARELLDTDVEAAQRGQRRIVTVLFGDIRNSSAYAQRLAPEDFVEALNKFFAEAHAAVWRHGGTLDKFLGDGLLAFFNAPREQADHALRAVRAAVDLVDIVRRQPEAWQFLGLENLRISVGITTGDAVVGYVGSGRRMQYTVIGATVNLAARLQELARDLDADILISEDTYAQIAQVVEVKDLGFHVVRGFEKSVHVYEVLSLRDSEGRMRA